MIKNKQLFCSKPFTWFEVTQVNEIGEVFMCCPAWLDMSIGNLRYQSVEEIWNGKKAQEIRRSILDGSFEYCNHSRCPFLQTVSGSVGKVEDIKDEDLRAVIEKGLTILPYGPREVNCSYDRSCNLSCPSCRTNIIVERENKQLILEIQDKIHSEALKDAELLYITGSGDPFGSPFFRKWLQTMKRKDIPSVKKIHLQTNAQLWTPKMWGTIAKDIQQLIKTADISIDAANPETYPINRRGGSFERLLENLKFISTLRKYGPLEWVGISMVVQENNFLEMIDFIRLGKRFNFDTVYFSQLVNWGTYSAEEFKNRAIHLPSHPRHSEFVDLLKNEIFNESLVNLGNLSDSIELRRSQKVSFTMTENNYYTDDFYESLKEGSRRSATEIIPLVFELIQPKSVVDVGCGLGTWLAVFKEFGIKECLGIDGDYINRDKLQILQEEFLSFDLRRPLHIDRKFDLVVSLEVAEHLPVESAETFVDSLTRLAPVILFSAAIPFQGGTGHINEQWPQYWVQYFQANKYVVIDCLRKKLWNNENVEPWYAQNILIFVKQDIIERYHLFEREFRNTNISQLAIVHPKIYLRNFTEKMVDMQP